MGIRKWLWGVALVAFCAALLPTPPGALANGVPVKVVLGYQKGVSTWGPKGAAGVADIAVGEGTVRVTAVGLPELDGQLYEGWLVNTRTGDRFNTGRFNASPEGEVSFERVYERIPDYSYDLYLMSVVDADVQTSEPTAEISLAGYFPVLKEVDPAAWPAELPYTGPELGGWTTAIALGIGGVLGFGLRSALWRGGRRP